jgi:hypothetical protein
VPDSDALDPKADQEPAVDGALDHAADADHPADAGPLDAKAQFAAALARKQHAGQQRSAHLDGHGVSGATANAKTSRTFRRKSG